LEKHIDLGGKRIRLFFHTDLDGTIAASLISLFSGATVERYMPCPMQNAPKPPKDHPDTLDVFVDCRSRDRDEDIRIDHHASNEPAEYLAKSTIIVDTRYESAVSLLNHYLGLSVHRWIIEEMDKYDSGKKNIFSALDEADDMIQQLLKSPGLEPDDYRIAERFKYKVMNAMAPGFRVEDITDATDDYERELELKYGVVIEDIKKEGKPLMKIVHTPVVEGRFREKVFTMTGAQFDKYILSYIIQHYYEVSKRTGIAIYVLVGFYKMNQEYNEALVRLTNDTAKEPFQVFAARSQTNATLNIGTLINEAKQVTGIANGGGRDTVGALNTANKDQAIRAINYIVTAMKERGP